MRKPIVSYHNTSAAVEGSSALRKRLKNGEIKWHSHFIVISSFTKCAKLSYIGNSSIHKSFVFLLQFILCDCAPGYSEMNICAVLNYLFKNCTPGYSKMNVCAVLKYLFKNCAPGYSKMNVCAVLKYLSKKKTVLAVS